MQRVFADGEMVEMANVILLEDFLARGADHRRGTTDHGGHRGGLVACS